MVVSSELKGMWKEAVTPTTRDKAQSLSELARRTLWQTSGKSALTPSFEPDTSRAQINHYKGVVTSDRNSLLRAGRPVNHGSISDLGIRFSCFTQPLVRLWGLSFLVFNGYWRFVSMKLKQPGCADDPHLPLMLRLRLCGAIYQLRCVVYGVQRVTVRYSVFRIYNKKLDLWHLLNLCFTA